MNQNDLKRTALTIHLDVDLKEWLDREAASRRCSLSQVVRELVLEKKETSRKKTGGRG